MSEQDQEQQEKVTLDDVVEVLAKHSTTPNDPDDAQKLSQFNQQVLDERTQKEEQQAEQQKKKEGQEPEERQKEAPTQARGVKPTGQRPGSSGKEGGS